MIVQLFCDNRLITTLQGSRDEVGAKLREAARNLALDVDDFFELQNRLTVLYQESGKKDLIYQTNHSQFRLHVPDWTESNDNN
jgi:hypothetical protein